MPSSGPLPRAESGSISHALRLERTGELSFRGGTHPGPRSRTFGGEVAGQAVMAAGQTVAPDRAIHAASMYFLRPGDTTRPVEFRVEVVRDGGAFSTRKVDAVQDGLAIFSMEASFHRTEDGLEHQAVSPDSPLPDAVPTAEELFTGDEENLAWVRNLSERLQVDIRFAALPARAAAARGIRAEPRQQAWLRARESAGENDLARAASLTYLSDVLLLSVALGPHEMTLQGGRLQFATVNHTVWYHRPCRVDEWFLYTNESRWAGGARALCHGEMFDAEGNLCATTMQEGLLRVRS